MTVHFIAPLSGTGYTPSQTTTDAFVASAELWASERPYDALVAAAAVVADGSTTLHRFLECAEEAANEACARFAR